MKSVAYFAGGCFWCLEAVFEELKGVESVTSGYSGGATDDPSYYRVATGKTGHAESIEVRFDADVISYQDLLNVFFSLHDPTTKDRQGPDVGSEYRSVIFYVDDEQKHLAEKMIETLTNDQVFSDPIVTELQPFTVFHPAENEHQDFYKNNQEAAYCQVNINPKILKLRQKFARFLKSN